MAQGTMTITDANGVQQTFALTITGGGKLSNTVIGDANGNLASTDGNTNLNTQSGGANSALNVTAAKVVKAAPGRLRKIIVSATGSSSGALTLNDCTTTGAAAAANQIISIPYGDLTVGQVISLDWPCLVGITVSAVPGSGSPIFAISFD